MCQLTKSLLQAVRHGDGKRVLLSLWEEKEKHKVDVKVSGSFSPQIKVWVDSELVATG